MGSVAVIPPQKINKSKKTFSTEVIFIWELLTPLISSAATDRNCVTFATEKYSKIIKNY